MFLPAEEPPIDVRSVWQRIALCAVDYSSVAHDAKLRLEKKLLLDDACENARLICAPKVRNLKIQIELCESKLSLTTAPTAETTAEKKLTVSPKTQSMDETLCRWAGLKVGRPIKSLAELGDASLFHDLVCGVLGPHRLRPVRSKPKMRIQMVELVANALKALQQMGIDLERTCAEDIIDRNEKLIGGVLFKIATGYVVCDGKWSTDELFEWVRNRLSAPMLNVATCNGNVLVDVIRAIVPSPVHGFSLAYFSCFEAHVKGNTRLLLMCLRRCGLARIPREVWGLILEKCFSPGFSKALAFHVANVQLGILKLLDAHNSDEPYDEQSFLLYLGFLRLGERRFKLQREQMEIDSLLKKIEEIESSQNRF